MISRVHLKWSEIIQASLWGSVHLNGWSDLSLMGECWLMKLYFFPPFPSFNCFWILESVNMINSTSFTPLFTQHWEKKKGKYLRCIWITLELEDVMIHLVCVQGTHLVCVYARWKKYNLKWMKTQLRRIRRVYTFCSTSWSWASANNYKLTLLVFVHRWREETCDL